jgi:glucose/arabinose dehydrogenase
MPAPTFHPTVRRFLTTAAHGLLLSLSMLLCANAWSAPLVSLRLVAQGFSNPVELVNARDGSGRLFVVEQGGKIRIVLDGSVLAAPYLDLSASGLISFGGERGLLGLAFHPQYPANGAFYVFYTRADDGALTIARYLRSAADANQADPASGAVLLTIPHPVNANHNGGHLAFGPDGDLYIGAGDGGGGGDVPNNAQNRGLLLGKLLRIGVDGGTAYAIPPRNPFAGAGSCNNGAAADASGTCPEIWASGLRNPWKFSFDRLTGDLLIGDVGQGAREEMDFQPAAAAGGRNYGWHVFEGNSCFTTQPECGALGNAVPPVITYGHDSQGGISITGGYRYRGTRSIALRGYYLYGDFGSTRIWAARPDGGGQWQPEVLFEPPLAGIDGISSFGEDEAGELHVASYGNGSIWALEGAPPGVARGDFDGGGTSDVFWKNLTTGQTVEWQMSGMGIAGAGSPATVADPNWQVVGNGDFDGDGKADLLWRNAGTGQTVIWLMDGQGIAAAASPNTVADLDWQVQGAGDFNGDGRADVLWRNSATGQLVVWLMNGTSIASAGSPGTVADPDWQVQGVGDFSGDGKADIFWKNAATGATLLWLMNGMGIVNASSPGTVADLRWQVQGVGDFDGDGRADMLWQNRDAGSPGTGAAVVWLMNGAAIRSSGSPTTVADPHWQVQGVGDYDGDGKADILWQHRSTGTAGNGQTVLWLMNGMTIRSSGSPNTVSDLDWQVQNPR